MRARKNAWVFALWVLAGLLGAHAATAYKPTCRSSTGAIVQCSGTLDNTQAPTAIATSSLTGTVAQANGGLGVDASALSNGVVVKSGGVMSTATAPAMSGANITANTVPADAIVPGTVDNTEFGYLDGLTGNVQSKLDSLTADLALATTGGNTFYLQETASDISGYETLRTQPSAAAEDFDEVSVTAGTSPLLIDPYATEPNALGIAQWPAGNWIFHIHSSVDSNTGDTRVRADVYSRTVGGVETLLFQATSPELVVGTTDYQWSTVRPEYQLAAQTDRLVVKFYATTTSVAARTVRIYYQGSTQTSYVTTPIPSPLPISGPANQVLATPNGSTGAVGPRALVYGDVSAIVGQTSSTLAAGNDNRLNPVPSGAGRLPYDTGSAYSSLAPGAANTILQSNGAAAPSWTSAPTVSGANITTATLPGSALTASSVATTKITGGTANRVLYDNGTNASWTAAPSSSSSFLRGSSPPAWDQINLNTDTQGVVPTAKGGTNLSSFTAAGIFYASDSSSMAQLALGTSGYVLTSNGTVPTYAAPVTATNSCASMSAASYTLTTSYGNIGLSLSLSAGTHIVTANVRTQIQATAGTLSAGLRLYNSTAGSAIANSDRLTNYSSGMFEGQTTPITEIITLGSTSTIEVQGLKSAGTFTSATVNSDSSGYSRLCAVKISS